MFGFGDLSQNTWLLRRWRKNDGRFKKHSSEALEEVAPQMLITRINMKVVKTHIRCFHREEFAGAETSRQSVINGDDPLRRSRNA
jgi:hypothetical protein